ncbi:hypothetical protein JCM10207_001307 [Rhodosporidiobolus poonsookiae]
MTATTPPAPRRAHLDLPKQAHNDLTLLILLADTPIPSIRETHGTYHDVFASLFRASLALARAEEEQPDDAGVEPAHKNSKPRRHKLTIKSYDVVEKQYPSEEEVKEADGLLITGSASNAYDDLDWINRLISFVADLPSANPDLKLIGICFGHQIISRAFGGVCERNEKGWEIGPRTLELTEVGQEVFRGKEQINVHQMHRDHVPSVPPNFELLASTDNTPVHGLVRFKNPSAPFSLTNISILTLQGHPEFDSHIINTLIDVREEKGIISQEVADVSREAAGTHDHGDWIGRRILGVFAV